jgi:hypothetical protein
MFNSMRGIPVNKDRRSRAHASTQAAALPDAKFAPLPHWRVISGMSRTATYYALGRGDLKAIKVGARTLIDVEAGLAWLRSLPAAEIRAPRAAA